MLINVNSLEAPAEAMIKSIARDPNISVNYAVRLFGSQREVEPEVMTAIVRSNGSCKAYVKKAIDVNINLPIPKNILMTIFNNKKNFMDWVS